MKNHYARAGKALFTSVAVPMLAAVATPANAVVTCAPTLCVYEEFDASTGVGYFNVDNFSATQTVVAFAVANDSVSSVNGVTELLGEWGAGIMTGPAWDAQKTAFETAYGLSIPLFSEAFGAAYSQAAVYWARDLLTPAEQAVIDGLIWSYLNPDVYTPPLGTSMPVLPGERSWLGPFSNYWPVGYTEGWSFVAGAAASPFVVLTEDLSQPGLQFSLHYGEAGPAPVPVPAALWLLGAGLLGLIGLGRRVDSSPRN